MRPYKMNLLGCLSAARPIKTSLHRSVILLCLLFLIPIQINAQTRGDAVISIESANGDTVLALGDTATFNIVIDTRGENIYGSTAYLSIPDSIFTPVFNPNAAAEYAPFIPGTWINAPAHQNSTFTDSLGQEANGIPGIQYNYSQSSLVGGNNSTKKGKGVLARFRLIPHTIPDNPTGEITLSFDNTSFNARETKYHQLPAGASPPTWDSKKYAQYLSLTVIIAGVKILPAIPDTNLVPGNSWTINLDNHFTSGIYLPSDPGVVWSQTPINTPAGANVIPDWPNRQIDITTTGTTHGTIEFDLFLSATGAPEGDFADTQRVTITVDHPPVFDQDLSDPLLLTFNEDTQLSHTANANGGGVLFTDQDDTGPALSIWLEPDSRVHLSYDDVNTVTFSADTNWFGTRAARLYVEDALGISIDTLLTFTVNSINDAPAVNLDSVGALGDTLIVHRVTPDTLDLLPFVTDADDTTFTWSVINPETNLSATPLAGDRLRLEAGIACPFSDIDLILTATDDSSASSSDTLVVSVRSWSPEIGSLPDIRILAGTPDTLSLNELVTDNDTPDASMTWTFTVVSSADSVTVDPQVTVTYNQPAQIAIFDTPTGYFTDPTDLLILTVEDDDNNTDTDTTRLAVFDSEAPLILPLPSLTVYRDSTHTGIIDLDDYVMDLQDDPEDIEWSYTGGDSLAGFDIDGWTHEVTITTNPTFLGYQTVSLIATDNQELKDTSDLVILVSRLFDGPPIWYALPDEIEVVYPNPTYLFNYSQVCYDETPTDSIIFTPYYSSDSLTVTIVAPDSVVLTTPDSTHKYTTWLYFSAKDAIDSVSYSDSILVHVKDSYSPVWERIPTVYLNVGETDSSLVLRDHIDDRDTDLSLLTFSVIASSQDIAVSHDPVTTRLTVIAGAKAGKSWLYITATDDKNNTASASVQVIVRTVYDDIPPDGDLAYFFNPATDGWIHYVAIADSTTDPTRFVWHYSYGSPPRNFSDSLAFALRDSLPGTLTWIAPFHFRNEGNYSLSVEITDYSGKMLEPAPSLSLAVGFTKVIGDVLSSSDQRLTVSYPAGPIPEDKLVIIAEDSRPELTAPGSAAIPGAGLNKKSGTAAPTTVYSLDTNLPEPILVTINYNQSRDADPYYSFYEVDANRLLKIETYTSTDGQFEAATTLDKVVVFARSDTPARSTPLPDAELLCYPNPFNATIQVRFILRTEDQGRIVIYNLLGQQVFASARQLYTPGVHPFSWHGIDDRGSLVPSGIYFIRLETQKGRPLTQKVTLLK